MGESTSSRNKKNCKRFSRVQFGTPAFSKLRLVYKQESVDDRRTFPMGNGKISIASEKESSRKTLLHYHLISENSQFYYVVIFGLILCQESWDVLRPLEKSYFK